MNKDTQVKKSKKWKYILSGIAILLLVGVLLFLFGGSFNSTSTKLGSVNTAFKMFGSDHHIDVSSFKDPDAQNVVCYLSRAKTGGIKGSLGIAEDTSHAAISCDQKGPVDITKIAEQQTEVYNESRSIGFKKLRVIRMFDKPNNTLVYMTYSDKLIEGDPDNAISAVSITN